MKVRPSRHGIIEVSPARIISEGPRSIKIVQLKPAVRGTLLEGLDIVGRKTVQGITLKTFATLELCDKAAEIHASTAPFPAVLGQETYCRPAAVSTSRTECGPSGCPQNSCSDIDIGLRWVTRNRPACGAAG